MHRSTEAHELAGGRFEFLPVKAERVEKAIAQDVAFLTAHPTRTRKAKPTRAASSQELGDDLLTLWRDERAARIPTAERLGGDDPS